jgi:hypothetical protein
MDPSKEKWVVTKRVASKIVLICLVDIYATFGRCFSQRGARNIELCYHLMLLS